MSSLKSANRNRIAKPSLDFGPISQRPREICAFAISSLSVRWVAIFSGSPRTAPKCSEALALLLELEEEACRVVRRDRVFLDRINLLESLNDTKLIKRYRLPRHVILELVDLIGDDLESPNKGQVRFLCIYRCCVHLGFMPEGISCVHAGI